MGQSPDFHKDRTHGWRNFAQELAGALNDRAAERRLANITSRPALPALPGALHRLAALS
jgi:hypothetical protein